MSRKGKGKVPPTLENKELPEPLKEAEQIKEEVGVFAAPIEIEFHVAAANVQKYETPQGALTVLNIISPVGISLTVKLTDENVAELVKDLQGEKSNIDVYTALPPGLAQ